MDIISEVADNIFMIAEYPENSAWGFQAFFIADEKSALIEPGPSNFSHKIIDGLHKLDYKPESLYYIIPTHIHADHCGGAGYLAQHSPDAKVIAHERGARHLVNTTKLSEASKAAWGENYESQIGPVIPVPQDKIEIVRGGEALLLGNRILNIIYAPGHAKHHICAYEASRGELFCGDSLGMLLPGDEITIIPVAAPPVFELDVALETIDRLKKLKPQTIFFSHFGVSHQASRCLESAEQAIKIWGNAVLEGLQAGEGPEQIKARLKATVEKLQPGRSRLFTQFIDWAVSGYTGYFTQKGLIRGYI